MAKTAAQLKANAATTTPPTTKKKGLKGLKGLKEFKIKSDDANTLRKKVRPVNLTPQASAKSSPAPSRTSSIRNGDPPTPANSSRSSLIAPIGSKRNSLLSLGSIRRPKGGAASAPTAPSPIAEQGPVPGPRYEMSPVKTKKPELPATTPMAGPPSPAPSNRSVRKSGEHSPVAYSPASGFEYTPAASTTSLHRPSSRKSNSSRASLYSDQNPVRNGVFDSEPPSPAWSTPSSVASSQKAPWHEDVHVAPQNPQGPLRDLKKIQKLSLNTVGGDNDSRPGTANSVRSRPSVNSLHTLPSASSTYSIPSAANSLHTLPSASSKYSSPGASLWGFEAGR